MRSALALLILPTFVLFACAPLPVTALAPPTASPTFVTPLSSPATVLPTVLEPPQGLAGMTAPPASFFIFLPILLIPPQGLAGPAAPPAPQSPCSNHTFAEGDSYVFACEDGRNSLQYRYTPETGSLHDLTVQVGDLPPFWVSFFGGPIFLFGQEEIPIWELDSLTRSHTAPRLTATGLEITWQLSHNGLTVEYTYRLSIHGRTLRLEVVSTGEHISTFSLDRSENTAGARILAVPYLSTFDLLFYRGFFVSAYFDWTQSDASRYEKVSQPFSETSFHFSQMAFYEPHTEGRRQTLHEVIYFTVSDRLADVLPTIPHLSSPYREVLSGRTVVDLWSEAPFAESQALLEALRQRSVTDLLVIRHTWQRCGFDDCYPNVLPARGEWGGDTALRDLAQTAREAGYLFALHENYADFYPNAGVGSPEDLALDPQGNPRLAWYNETTGVQAHLLSPFRALHYANQYAPEIHRRYGTSATFLDVHTAVPPWEKTDYNARSKGSARFLPVLQAYSDLLSYLRTAHAGPILGEGGAHFLYAGLVDGVAAEYEQSGSTLPLVDFALLRLHPLMVNHGVGYFPYYFAQDGNPKWSGYTRDDHYRYMANEIAFCHAGYVDTPELMESPEAWLEWVEREARLVAPIHRRCATAQATRVLYRVSGELVGVEQAVAAQQAEQVFVEYDNGLQVYVNRHPTQSWQVTLDFTPSWADFSALANGTRQDFVGAPQSVSFLLPPHGWVAVMR